MLTIDPELAQAIGLNKAIVVGQLDYWLQHSTNEALGRRWVYNTLEQWQEQFPFWSVGTIRRLFDSLVSDKIVIREKLGSGIFRHTYWYRLDYAALEQVINLNTAPSDQPDHSTSQPSDQPDQSGCSKRSLGVINLISRGDQSDQNYKQKNTHKTTQDKTHQNGARGAPDIPPELPANGSEPEKQLPELDEDYLRGLLKSASKLAYRWRYFAKDGVLTVGVLPDEQVNEIQMGKALRQKMDLDPRLDGFEIRFKVPEEKAN